MDKHPNQLLNEYAAHYVIRYLGKVNFQKTNTPINNAAWSFLRRSKISFTTNPWTLGQEAYYAADLQRQLVLEGHANTSLRSIVREFPVLRPMVTHGPQSWLIRTYQQPLENIFELDNGSKKYGINQPVYRNITENVMAARMMFNTASHSLASKLFNRHSKTPNLGFFEGGAGNGAAIFDILNEFHNHGIFPEFLLSDIDEKTMPVAKKYFQDHGFPGNHFPWKKIDIGNPKDMIKVTEYFEYHSIVINVNFIIHEWEPIAEKFFRSTSNLLPNAELAVSEFFLPEHESMVDHTYPWWFVFLHDLSGQKLRTERELLNITKRYGYKTIDRINHQKINETPVVSTLFLRK